MKATDHEIADALMAGHGIASNAARILGMSAEQVRNRIRKNDELKRVRDSMRNDIVDLAESGLFEALKRQKQWAIQYVLSTLGKNRGYSTKLELESDDAGQGQIVIFEIPDNGRDPKVHGKLESS